MQDTSQINEKGHFTDVSELVATVDDFLALPAIDGKTVLEVYPDAVFFASEKAEA